MTLNETWLSVLDSDRYSQTADRRGFMTLKRPTPGFTTKTKKKQAKSLVYVRGQNGLAGYRQ